MQSHQLGFAHIGQLSTVLTPAPEWPFVRAGAASLRSKFSIGIVNSFKRHFSCLIFPCFQNSLRHTIQIFSTHHPEAQHPVTFRLKEAVRSVIFLLVKMLTSVQFNHQFLSAGHEINNIRTNSVLADESEYRIIGACAVPPQFISASVRLLRNRENSKKIRGLVRRYAISPLRVLNSSPKIRFWILGRVSMP